MDTKPIKIKQTIHLTFLTLLLILLIIGKDVLHSSIQNYSFYLSESLLFSSFWVLFIPMVLLNKKIAIKKYPKLSLIWMSLLHISFFSLIVYLMSELLFEYPFSFNKVFINSISDNGIVCLMVYGILNYSPFQKNQAIKNTAVKENVLVRFQNRTVVINIEDIVYLKSEKPYIKLVTKERNYLYNSSLKQFLTQYPNEMFIQVHKSTIINKNCVISFNSRKNGDYDVELTNQDIVRASRTYRNYFKCFI